MYKLERKFGKFAVSNLMTVIVGAMAILYFLDFIIIAGSDGETGVTQILAFDRSAIISGQIWRLITFALLPPGGRLIFVIFALYLYWLIGSSLEAEWGSFKFNVFYLIGVLGTIAVGFITGFSDNTYLNLSMFFAFAIFYPDFEIVIFFILPVKVKYLAIINLIFFIYMFIIGGWTVRLCILVAFLNIFLFFGSRIKGWGKRKWLNLKFRYIRRKNSRRERRR